VIRWRAGASSDVLRQRARCTMCEHNGATIQHPGWAGEHVGVAPFPLTGDGPPLKFRTGNYLGCVMPIRKFLSD
jgi:hypothetical protein